MNLRQSLLPVFAMLAAGASAQVVIIYDTITGNAVGGHTTLTPRHRMADGFSTILAPPALWWRVHRVDVVQNISAAATYANVTANLVFHNGFAPATATGSVFSAVASNTTWALPTFTATAAGGAVRTFDFQATNQLFDLVDGQTMGLTVTWLVGGAADARLATGLINAAPTVGTSPHGYYRDVDNDGIIELADWSDTISGVGRPTNSNAMFRIHAEAVPEPATLLILGAGAAALAARRRRKK